MVTTHSIVWNFCHSVGECVYNEYTLRNARKNITSTLKALLEILQSQIHYNGILLYIVLVVKILEYEKGLSL